MENIKIISDSGIEINVYGIFFVFNSKYYFVYTENETDENDYVKLYVVQVCKEIQNLPTGPVDTGYMLGMQITNDEEWSMIQNAITQIVEYKKTGKQSGEIQYLPISMLINLKIISKNRFKLMKHILEENFNVIISQPNNLNSVDLTSNETIIDNQQSVDISGNKSITEGLDTSDSTLSNDVIIDYRTRFFEEQEKNKDLEEKIRILEEKLNNIKNIIGE